VSNEVVNYADAPIEVRKSYASTLSSAGDLLPRGLTGIINPGTPEQRQGIVPGRVLLVLETGAMLGINPMAALQGINIIEGSASISPALMQAVIRRAGHRMRVDVTGTVADGTIASRTLSRGLRTMLCKRISRRRTFRTRMVFGMSPPARRMATS
jgi:hypothetical protein